MAGRTTSEPYGMHMSPQGLGRAGSHGSDGQGGASPMHNNWAPPPSWVSPRGPVSAAHPGAQTRIISRTGYKCLALPDSV